MPNAADPKRPMKEDAPFFRAFDFFWRERSLAIVYGAGLLVGMVGLLPMLFFLAGTGQWLIIGLDLAVVILACMGLVFRRRISYTVRAWGVLLTLYVVGVALLYHIGPGSTGAAWLFTFAVMAGVFMGLRAAALTLAINAFTLTALGVIIAAGLPPWAAGRPDALESWPIASTNLLLLNIIASVSVAVLTQTLEDLLVRETEARAHLDRERENLQEANRRLLREAAERETAQNLMRIQRDLGTALAAASDTAQVARLSVSAMREIDEVEAAGFYKRVPQTGALHLESAGGGAENLVSISKRFGPGSPQAGLVAAGRAVHGTQREIMEWLPVPAEKVPVFESVRAASVVPVLHEGQVVAALVAIGRNPEFSPGITTGLEGIGGQIDGALARIMAEGASRESEERYRTLFEHTPDGILITDYETRRVRYANPALCQLLGFAEEDLHDLLVEDLHPPDIREIVMERFRNPWDAVETASALPVLRKDGTVILADLTATRTYLEGRIRVLGFFRDVTARKKAEAELAASQALLTAAVEQSPSGILVVDAPSGIVRLANRSAQHTLGMADKRFMGIPWEQLARHWPLNHPDGRFMDLAERPLYRAVHFGEVSTDVEMLIRRSDGTERAILANASPVLNEQGVVAAAIVVFVDITERRRTEQALEDSEQRHRSLIEDMPIGLCIIEIPNARFLFFNQRILDMFGYTYEEGLQLSIFDVIDPQELDRARRGMDNIQHASSRQNRRLRYTGLRKDGSRLLFEVRFSRIVHEGRDALQAMVVDVTHIDQLERQLIHAQRMEALGTLTSGVAHDFNNLLQAASGYVEILGRMPPSEPGLMGYVGEIGRILDRGADLVRRLLTFGRKVETSLMPIDMNIEIRHAASMLERTLPRMIAIDLFLDEDLPLVEADSGQLEQVILNLGNNAKDAMPEGGRLIISTARVDLDPDSAQAGFGVNPGPYCQVTVTDTGSGMDEATLEHVFEPFFTTKAPDKGTGLGLATVYGIVRSHGGAISCWSRLGEGTSFVMVFPALTDDRRDLPGGGQEPVEEAAGGHETILVVDDEEAIREVACAMLENHGYRVVTAESGEAALELYQNGTPRIDLVIMDLSMPGMGGEAAVAEIFRLDSKARVIISSGYVDPDAVGESAGGTVRHLIKPWRGRVLLQTVRESLDA